MTVSDETMRSGGPPPPRPGQRPPRRRHGLKGHLRAYFLAGILVMAPISIALHLGWFFVTSIDDWVGDLVPLRYHPETYLPFSLPGMGVLIVVAALTLVGMLAAGFVGHAVLRLGEAILARVPILRSVYGAIKQVLRTALAPQSRMFHEVVLVEYPAPGAWAIGLVTGPTEGEASKATAEPMVNVFLPKAITAYKGFTLLLPQRDVVPLSISVEEAFKLLASGGLMPLPAGGRRPSSGRDSEPGSAEA